MRGWGIGVAVALAALTASAPAHAALAQVQTESGNKGPSTDYAVYFAEPGEPNDLTVTYAAGRYTFADAVALVKAGNRCTSVDPHTVRCPAPAPALRVNVADGNDRVRAPQASFLWAGPGDDTIEAGGNIHAGDGDDLVLGSEESDRIDLGVGRDRAFGRGGNDSFGDDLQYPGDPPPRAERDEVDGGPGTDHMAYNRRTAPVRVDLRAGVGGEAGEGDVLVNVEGAGSTGDGDVLIGTDAGGAFNTLGASFVATGGGSDSVYADTAERNRIDAGAGDDGLILSSRWSADRALPERDEVRCGPGFDTVTDAAPNIPVPVDCERAVFDDMGGPTARLPGRAAAPGEPLLVSRGGECQANSGICRITGRVRVATRAEADELPRSGAVLASAEAVVRGKATPRLVLRPNARGGRLLERGTCVLATVKLTGLGDNDWQLGLFRFGRRCRAPAPLAP